MTMQNNITVNNWPYKFKADRISILGVRMFTHMVSCHHEEALNFKFKHKRANKSLSDVDRVAQCFKLSNQIAIKTNCRVATHKGPNICTHYRSWPWIN